MRASTGHDITFVDGDEWAKRNWSGRLEVSIAGEKCSVVVEPNDTAAMVASKLRDALA